MPPLDQAYAQALQGGTIPQEEAPQAVPQAEKPVNINPMTQQGDEFFLDPMLLGDGPKCKVGEEIMVKAKVQSVGSKIGAVPVEVTKLGAEGQEDESY